MKRAVLMVIASFITQCIFAETIKTVTENNPVYATISKEEPTRIQVVGDRIQNVIHKSGLFALQENPTLGEIFITPTFIGDTKPINLYVITEKGRTYTLILSPKDIPASSVVLNPDDTNLEASDWERQTPWQQSIISLMKAMVQGKLLPGFQREVKASELAFDKGISLTQIEIYRGHLLQGEIYRVVNECSDPFVLTETRFYRPGVVAVLLEKNSIPAKGEAFVYVVTSAQTIEEGRHGTIRASS